MTGFIIGFVVASWLDRIGVDVFKPITKYLKGMDSCKDCKKSSCVGCDKRA